MRVIPVKKPISKRRHRGRWLVLLLLVLVLAAGTANYVRPLPRIEASDINKTTVAAKPLHIAWPGYGQASLATADGTLLATNGNQTPFATASIAKVITSLCVLQKYPLKAGEAGPTITLTGADVALHDAYVAKDGSVVDVVAGEQLTERQLLEALMLPSANNLADTAAIWAYGSLDAYHTYANQYIARNGLINTHVAVDASGLDGATTSTASDLAKLGSLALQQPALMQIVSEPTAVLPVAGTVHNYNFALGKQGIFGIKTGNNDQDLGAFLFATKLPVGTSSITVTGAVMGAGSLAQALQDSVSLLASAQSNFSVVSLATKAQAIATYKTPWGASDEAVTTNALEITRWNAQVASSHAVLVPVDVSKQVNGGVVGTLYGRLAHTSAQTNVTLAQPLAGPSFWWRLTRH